VLKYDVIDGKNLGYISYGGMYGAEALFVPRSNARSGDDGYLFERSDLLAVDPSTTMELARLHLPQHVHFGVHATWPTSNKAANLS